MEIMLAMLHLPPLVEALQVVGGRREEKCKRRKIMLSSLQILVQFFKLSHPGRKAGGTRDA
jgi:hypothetical protein